MLPNVELVPMGQGGDLIGIWPKCPNCGKRWFMLASEFNEEDAYCKYCKARCFVRGLSYPYCGGWFWGESHEIIKESIEKRAKEELQGILLCLGE